MNTVHDYDYEIYQQHTEAWPHFTHHLLVIGQYRSAEAQAIEAGKVFVSLLYDDGRIHDSGYINQFEKAEGILRNWVEVAEQHSTLYKLKETE